MVSRSSITRRSRQMEACPSASGRNFSEPVPHRCGFQFVGNGGEHRDGSLPERFSWDNRLLRALSNSEKGHSAVAWFATSAFRPLRRKSVRILAVIAAVLLAAMVANEAPAGAPPNSVQVAAIESAKPEKPLHAGEAAASASRNPATKDSGAPESVEEAGLANIFAIHGYVLGFLVVLLGGLALNLTPCVYPLIGVTIAYFGNQGGAPRKVAILAMIYVLGIALMFSGVGVAVAVSSFGFFSLQPPQWMMRRAGTARPGYIGALTMGLGMGVVAAPCIGPIVLGLLLMVQRSQSAVFGFALFFTLAVGLGLPYVALALAAGSIRGLPRSGEWLSWVEQLFGFVLVGLALYFIDPVVPGRLITRFLPYYAAIVGVFLGFISPSGRNWQPFLFVRSAISVISLATLVYLLVPSCTPRNELAFAPFNLTLVEAAQTERKPVVVDFAADWCVPCREMERTTFVDPTVVRAASGFVLLKANLTAESDQNAALMKRFNIQGVPTTMFIDSNGKVRKRRVGYVGPDEFLRYLHQFN